MILKHGGQGHREHTDYDTKLICCIYYITPIRTFHSHHSIAFNGGKAAAVTTAVFQYISISIGLKSVNRLVIATTTTTTMTDATPSLPLTNFYPHFFIVRNQTVSYGLVNGIYTHTHICHAPAPITITSNQLKPVLSHKMYVLWRARLQ